jgi:hypothetical protein
LPHSRCGKTVLLLYSAASRMTGGKDGYQYF